jgi:hypothetical protein
VKRTATPSVPEAVESIILKLLSQIFFCERIEMQVSEVTSLLHILVFLLVVDVLYEFRC